jgi:hypothetical protein
MRWEGHVADMRSKMHISVAKPEGNGQLGRPRGRLEDNTKTNLTDKEFEACGQILLVQDGDQ